MSAAAWIWIAKLVAAAALLALVVAGVRGCQEHYRGQGRDEVQGRWDADRREQARMAEAARAQRERAEREKEQTMDALLVGWQPAEVVWTLRDVAVDGANRQMVLPERVVKRSHRRFVYVQEQDGPHQLRLLTRGEMQRGIEVPERKFIVHRGNAEEDNPYRTGLGLQLYWPVTFKRKGVLAWTKFLDRFGLPIPWGKYPVSATPRDKGTLSFAARAGAAGGVP